MRLNSKGQVTIPAELRHRFGFVEGDEVDVIADGDTRCASCIPFRCLAVSGWWPACAAAQLPHTPPTNS